MKKVFKIELKAKYNVEMEIKNSWFLKSFIEKKTFNVNNVIHTVAESNKSEKIKIIENKLKMNRKKLLDDGASVADMNVTIYKKSVVAYHNEELTNQVIEIEELDEVTPDDLKRMLNYKDYIELINQ